MDVLANIQALIALFPYAILAGLVIATTCTLLGVFTILKRVVFVGITLSEVAACGIAVAMILHVHPFVGAATLTLTTVAILAYPFELVRIPRDAVLGVIFVCASALSILLVAKSGFGLREVKALLYGDLILTSPRDLRIILTTLLPVLVYLIAFLRPSLYTFLDRETAKLLGIRVAVWELLFFFALGLAVSAASKVAGALLIFCYLVVPPAAALLLVRQIWWVMGIGVLLALVATCFGYYWSFSHDLPTNQTIVVASCIFFAFILGLKGVRQIVLKMLAKRNPIHNELG